MATDETKEIRRLISETLSYVRQDILKPPNNDDTKKGEKEQEKNIKSYQMATEAVSAISSDQCGQSFGPIFLILFPILRTLTFFCKEQTYLVYLCGTQPRSRRCWFLGLIHCTQDWLTVSGDLRTS